MPKTTNAPYPCETTTNRLYAERHVTDQTGKQVSSHPLVRESVNGR